MPSILLDNSEPVYFERSHAPCFNDAVACGILRANAKIWLNANSPVDTVLPPGVFTTNIFLLVAYFTSILSTPVPARPTNFKFLPASITSWSTFVPLLTTKPS